MRTPPQPDWEETIRGQLLESAQVKEQLARHWVPAIHRAARATAERLRQGGRVLFCGNGGSAADCQHLAAELVARTSASFPRPPVAALALTADTSCLTALGNDYGFERVFARQVEALGRPEDVLIAITTSGQSENVVQAVQAARARNILVIGLLGGDGGRLKEVVDMAIIVPSQDMPRIQEGHIAIGHILCHLVERMLYEGSEGERHGFLER